MDIREYSYTVEVDMAPVPKGRPRFTSQGRVYTPKRTRNAEDAVVWGIGDQAPEEPFSGALAVRIIYYIERPKSVPKKKRKWPSVRPDLDNYNKLILDAGNKLGLWNDDAQIVKLNATKLYADETSPRIIISIEPLDGRKN